MNQIPTRFLTKSDLGKFVTTFVTKQGVTFVYVSDCITARVFSCDSTGVKWIETYDSNRLEIDSTKLPTLNEIVSITKNPFYEKLIKKTSWSVWIATCQTVQEGNVYTNTQYRPDTLDFVNCHGESFPSPCEVFFINRQHVKWEDL